MSQWPDTRLLDLLGIDLPIIQAPMAGATTADMVIAARRSILSERSLNSEIILNYRTGVNSESRP